MDTKAKSCLLVVAAITKEEENYEEAVKAINSCFGGGQPNSTILDILSNSSCIELNKDVIDLPTSTVSPAPTM